MTTQRIIRQLRTPAQQQLVEASRVVNDKAELFGIAWRNIVGRIPEDSGWRREHEFAKPERRWRFDWAHIPTRVAVEIDGGNRMARINASGRAVAVGRHTQDDDYEKLNNATARGWKVYRATTAMMMRDPDGFVRQVAKAMGISVNA